MNKIEDEELISLIKEMYRENCDQFCLQKYFDIYNHFGKLLLVTLEIDTSLPQKIEKPEFMLSPNFSGFAKIDAFYSCSISKKEEEWYLTKPLRWNANSNFPHFSTMNKMFSDEERLIRDIIQ